MARWPANEGKATRPPGTLPQSTLAGNSYHSNADMAPSVRRTQNKSTSGERKVFDHRVLLKLQQHLANGGYPASRIAKKVLRFHQKASGAARYKPSFASKPAQERRMAVPTAANVEALALDPVGHNGAEAHNNSL